jgi:peroxiredoxin Q/BCP
MAQLRQDYHKFVTVNTEIIVVGSEKAEVFIKFWAKEDLPFIGLPDPEQSIQKLYGQEVNPLKLGRLPAQMLIDKSCVLRYVHYGNSMKDIPSNEAILDLIEP